MQKNTLSSPDAPDQAPVPERREGQTRERIVDATLTDLRDRERALLDTRVREGWNMENPPDTQRNDVYPVRSEFVYPRPRTEASSQQKETRRENTETARKILELRSVRIVRQIESLRVAREAAEGEPSHYIYHPMVQFGGGPHGIAAALAAEKKFGSAGARLIVHAGTQLSPVFSAKEDTNFFAEETLLKANPDVDPFRGVLAMTSTDLAGNDMPSTGNVGELILRAAALLESPVLHQAKIVDVEICPNDPMQGEGKGWDVPALFRTHMTYQTSDGNRTSIFVYTDQITDATGMGGTRIPVPLDEVLLDAADGSEATPVKIERAVDDAIAALNGATVDRNRLRGWMRWRAKLGRSFSTDDLLSRLRQDVEIDADGEARFREAFHPDPVRERSTYHARRMIQEQMSEASRSFSTASNLPSINKATAFIPGMRDRINAREKSGEAPEILGAKPGRWAIIGGGDTALVCAKLLSDAFLKRGISPTGGQPVVWLSDTMRPDKVATVRQQGIVNLSPLSPDHLGGVTVKRIEERTVKEDGGDRTEYCVSFGDHRNGESEQSMIFDHVIIAAGFENTMLEKFGEQAEDLRFAKMKALDPRLDTEIAVAQELRSFRGKTVPAGAYRVVGPAANGIPPENRIDSGDASPLPVPADFASCRKHLPEFAWKLFDDLEHSPVTSSVERSFFALADRYRNACPALMEFYSCVKNAPSPEAASHAVPLDVLEKLNRIRDAGDDMGREIDELLRTLENPYYNTSHYSLDQLLHRTLAASEDNDAQNAHERNCRQILASPDDPRGRFLRRPLTGDGQTPLLPSLSPQEFTIKAPDRRREKANLYDLNGRDAPHASEVAVGLKMRITDALQSLRLTSVSHRFSPTSALLRCTRRGDTLHIDTDGVRESPIRALLEKDRDLLIYLDAVLENYGDRLDVSIGFNPDGSVDATRINILSPLDFICEQYDALPEEQRRNPNALRRFVHRLNPLRLPYRLLGKRDRNGKEILPPDNSEALKERIVQFYRRQRNVYEEPMEVKDPLPKESGAYYYLIYSKVTNEPVAAFTVYPNQQHQTALNYLHAHWKIASAGLGGQCGEPMDAVLIRHKDGDEHIAVLTEAASGKEVAKEAPPTANDMRAIGRILAAINDIDRRPLSKNDSEALKREVSDADARLNELRSRGVLSEADLHDLTGTVGFNHGDPRFSNCFTGVIGQGVAMTGYYNGHLGSVGGDLLKVLQNIEEVANSDPQQKATIRRAFLEAYLDRLRGSR